MENSKEGKYDLEDRTFQFAKQVRVLITKLPKTITNIEDGKQVIRSSGSVGANYIEANEALSKKDLLLRIRISRKEAKESGYWLKLLNTEINKNFVQDLLALIQESKELMMILSAIMRKVG